MTIAARVGGPAVTVKQPVVAKLLTFAARTTASIDHILIDVPYAVCQRVRIFLPPGVNYRVQLQIGFNGSRMLPTANLNDYIAGPGFMHEYPWGIPVQKQIDVWALCNNRFPHTVYVAFDLDYAPIERAAEFRAPRVLL